MTGKEWEGVITVFFVQGAVFMTTVLGVYAKIHIAGKKREKAITDKIEKTANEVKAHADASVQKLNGMLTYVIHSIGFPAWLKVARQGPSGEVEFRMLELNEDYASTFGISRLSYIGKTDLEAGWDYHTAQTFRQQDLTVWASGEALEVVERVGETEMRFRKIRVQSSDGHLRGILGLCIDHPQSQRVIKRVTG